MNKVNLLEIYYGVYRDDDIHEAKNVIEKIENLPVTIIDTLTDGVFNEAGKLKAKNRISLADAIAIGEANVRDAELVTCHAIAILTEWDLYRKIGVWSHMIYPINSSDK